MLHTSETYKHILKYTHQKDIQHLQQTSLKMQLLDLMECTLYKLQYTGKSERAFNLKLNNHRKGVYKTNAPEAVQRSRVPGHNFNRHAKFTLIPSQKDSTSNLIYLYVLSTNIYKDPVNQY